jgi:hypothetical protein
MHPTAFKFVSLREFAHTQDLSFQFTLFEDQAPDYLVPAAACAPRDSADPDPALLDGFIKERRETPPQFSLTYLRNCYVLPNAAIVTASGHVITESCYPYTTPWISFAFAPWLEQDDAGKVSVNLGPIEHVKGPTFYCREHGEQGFFHWMHSVFPRLDALRRQHFRADYKLLYMAEQHFQKDGLRFAGLEARRVVAPAMRAVQLFDELVFPAPLVERGEFWLRSMDVGRFYDSLPAPESTRGRRLYITRQGAAVRRLRNEPELLEFLAQHGFTAVAAESLSFAEQLATFRNCEFMLGVHGAGLSHAISMPPGARLLEILHPRRFWATYRAISARRGIHYGFLVGEDPGPDVEGDAFDFEVDIGKLTEVFRMMYG